MRKIECDICSCTMKNAQALEITETFVILIRKYTSLTEPDICSNCTYNLEKQVEETIQNWRLNAPSK